MLIWIRIPIAGRKIQMSILFMRQIFIRYRQSWKCLPHLQYLQALEKQ